MMIGAVRSMGLAARYVSGYLRSGARVQGAEASHAWVSVFIPGAGWMDIDPTNDIRPATGHITLAWGRDYGDVAPVRGRRARRRQPDRRCDGPRRSSGRSDRRVEARDTQSRGPINRGSSIRYSNILVSEIACHVHFRDINRRAIPLRFR